MKEKLKVLILEDNPSDAVLVLRELRKVWEEVEYVRVFSARDMKRELFAEEWDLIISDYSMPQFTGLDGLKILKESGLDLPFIMVSGTMGEDVAVSVMKAGAGDYILKDKLHRLVPAIERELAEKVIRYEHKKTAHALNESEALSQAVIDGSPLGISVRDRYGTLILYNQSWQEMWGITDEEIAQAMIPRQKLKFDERDEYLQGYLDQLRDVYVKGKEAYFPELKLGKTTQNNTKWISQHFYALKNENDEVERIVVLSEDITARKNQEKRQNLSRRVLQILNKKGDWEVLLHQILQEMQQTLDYESLGIRLAESGDFPYIESIGFSDVFLEKEKYLCSNRLKSSDKIDEKPPVLDCLCGKILMNKIDKNFPFITDNGSFWTNDLTELVKQPEFNDDKIITRYQCLKSGYRSVALIPLISGSEILGLIQINDRKRNIFTHEIIKYFEELGSTVAIAYQRKLSEEKLMESEKQFRSLFENSIMGIFRLSAQGRILMMNPCLINLLGFNCKEEFFESSSETRDDFTRITRKLYNTYKLEHNLIQQFDATWKRSDGKIVFVNISAIGIENESGELLYLDGTVEDRTYRMKATKALMESRELYKSLVEKANVGIVTDNLAGQITYFNNTFAHLFGYSPEEMKSLSYAELFHPDFIDLMQKYHELRIAGKESPPRYEMRGIKKDGSIIDLEISVDHILNDEYQIIGTRAFMWDVTEKKQADAVQQALYNISLAVSSTENLAELYYRIKENLDSILDTTNIFVALYDRDKDELSLPFEVDEKDHFDSFPAGNTLTSYIIKHGEPVMFSEEDINRLAKHGEIDLIGTPAKIFLGAPLKIKEEIMGVIVLQSYDNPKLYSHKDLQILSIISTEIANAIDKKKAEENLRVAHEELKILHKSLEEKVKKAVQESREKDQVIMQQSRQVAIGEMISSIAHHWRQPLNVIGVTFQSVREAFEYEELTKQYMDEKTDIIVGILKSLSKTIDDFRYFYRQDEKSRDFDVKEAVLNTVYTIQSKFTYSNIELNTDLAEGCVINGYMSEFSQAVLNILTNAYDILTERKIDNPRVDINLTLHNDHLRLSIKDNGGGVEKNIRNQIFELYTSTKKNLNNTGIGLYIAKLIIEKHLYGKLNLIDKPEGAEFVIEV